MVSLPRQVALVLAQFPKGEWSQSLVNAINQFSLEVVQAFRFSQPVYKVLSFSVGDEPTESFPIDFPVTSTPVDVWVAAVPAGDVEGLDPITVKWAPIVANGNQLAVRVNFITGLASNTTYSVRLGYR